MFEFIDGALGKYGPVAGLVVISVVLFMIAFFTVVVLYGPIISVLLITSK